MIAGPDRSFCMNCVKLFTAVSKTWFCAYQSFACPHKAWSYKLFARRQVYSTQPMYPIMTSSFLSVLAVVFISLLSSSIIPKVQGGQHVRRSADAYHPNSEFIMDNSLLFVNGYASIYLPSGQVAFMITRHIIDPQRGTSQYILIDGANGQTLLIMDSYDDTCYSKSHYNDEHGLAHFTVDPRGIKADKWYFHTPALLGSKFVFDRDYLGKGGQVKDQNSGKIVATLSIEKRKEPWLLSLFASTMAFVLRTDGAVPAVRCGSHSSV